MLGAADKLARHAWGTCVAVTAVPTPSDDLTYFEVGFGGGNSDYFANELVPGHTGQGDRPNLKLGHGIADSVND